MSEPSAACGHENAPECGCVQTDPLPPRDRFLLLRIEADACRSLEYQLEQRRTSRDRIALGLVDAGYTWRDVAEVAGFKNPYIATLKRRHRAA